RRGFSSAALRLGLRFWDCARCVLVFGAYGSFRIRELQPCRRIAGRGPCCQIWRKQRRRIPFGTSQWLGKPLRSDPPWSSAPPRSHHEKDFPRVPPCSASSPGWSATRTKLGCRSPGGSLQGAMEEYPVARPQQTVTDRASSSRAASRSEE